jgi:hypothetical protein
MLQFKQNCRLHLLLGGAVIGAVLCSPTATLATALKEYGWAKPMLIPGHVRQEIIVLQHVDEGLTSCFYVVMPTQQSKCARMTPTNWQAREQQGSARSDQPEPLPPTTPTPPLDLPEPPDPEPEPYTNLPAPAVPPSVQPKPAQPGLPPPSMPEPAAPHLAPPPPPMPQPAEPPPLSQRPDLNPANPGTLEQQPTPAPQSKPEPTTDRAL